MKKRLALLWVTVLTVVLSGCGGRPKDPTEKFKDWMTLVDKEAHKNEELSAIFDLLGPVKFDVRKTDSTVKPFAAEASISGNYIGEADRYVEFRYKYFYQDDKWQEDTSSWAQERLESVRRTGSLPPDPPIALQVLFTNYRER
jgi:hypothetical protein